MTLEKNDIPIVLAGPILRKVLVNEVSLWIAVSCAVDFRVSFSSEEKDDISIEKTTYILDQKSPQLRLLRAGNNLFYALITLPMSSALPENRWVNYTIETRFSTNHQWQNILHESPNLHYHQKKSLGFQLSTNVSSLLHGSCRKPHHPFPGDGLVEADRYLSKQLEKISEVSGWPSLLILSGDQIYADDVSGPLLSAIHQLIHKLGVFEEELPSEISHSNVLYQHKNTYYGRHQLLPKKTVNRGLFRRKKESPVFTADNPQNHLMTLAEYLMMYLLVWSPVPWSLIDIRTPECLEGKDKERFFSEKKIIEYFIKQLQSVRRLYAHLPTAMIFDDHDISDDWNLNREWEEGAYGNDFSRRIIGNGLLAYLINQGWGNNPEAFPPSLMESVASSLINPGNEAYDKLLSEILRFDHWDYHWETNPSLIVLDTRTRRWRSESKAYKPSGLLDWEALTDLQQMLKNKTSVILVSAGPIFGVKVIEAIQRIFSFLGLALVVDAENWMAHPGTANGILNVFRHSKTPQHFIVLSGDVHYSFVYDVELRGKSGGPDIWQICSSGLRNNFPDTLLKYLDYTNQSLYSPHSLLNWFTKRRDMRIVARYPKAEMNGRRLLNAYGTIGLVEIDSEGRPFTIKQLIHGGKEVTFVRKDESFD